jgi:D-alanyl-D-alanine carboxypeptidase (penicillin-binding protein 5/6)
MENETFRRVVSTKTVRLGKRSLCNHNRLLWRYDGAVGVKTGYTKKAGRLLVSAAERGGRRLIAVTIRAPDDWNDHAALLDYGFSGYAVRVLAEKGDLLGGAAVIGGETDAVRFAAAETAAAMLRAGEKPAVRICAPRAVFAPVTAGDPAGYAEFRVGRALLARVPLAFMDACAARGEEKKESLLSRILEGIRCGNDCRS